MKNIFLYTPVILDDKSIRQIKELGYHYLDNGSFLTMIDIENKIICKPILDWMYKYIGSHYDIDIFTQNQLCDLSRGEISILHGSSKIKGGDWIRSTVDKSKEKIIFEIPEQTIELINILKCYDYLFYKKKKNNNINLIYEQ